MSPEQLPFWIQHSHRNLRPDNHFVTSPRTGDYNCVAWALGRDDDWLEPGGRTSTTWPAGLPDGEGLGPYIALFELHGYALCDSGDLEDGFEKVALYGDEDGFAHVARQLRKGWWTSKLGILHDIEHATLASLEDDKYGSVQAVLRRPVGDGS